MNILMPNVQWLIFYQFISTIVSILWCNLLQALAMVSLGRLAITSLVLASREVAVL
jgi:hypothetical protein